MASLAILLLSLAPATSAQQLPTCRPIDAEPPPPSALTTGGLVWTFPAGGYQPYIALGDRGSQVTAILFDDSLRLLSSFDANPPTPVWTADHLVIHSGLAAASESDVYLHFEVRVSGVDFSSRVTLKMFRSRSNVPAWRYDFPVDFLTAPEFDLSRDGRTIVSAYPNGNTSDMEVRVHDPSTGAPLRTILLPGYILYPRFDLSPDGAVCAFSDYDCRHTTEVFDTATGAHLASLPGGIRGNQALSDGGRVLATFDGTGGGAFTVRVYARHPGGYAPILDVPLTLGMYPGDLAVSDDGTTLAAGWRDSNVPRRGIVRAYDLATAAMTMEHVDTGTTHDIVPDSISISADGSRFAIGQWGDGAGDFPELAVYSPTSSVPLRANPANGNVFEVELSPDGKRYAVTRTPGNGGYTEAFVEFYEFGREDLVVHGTPSLGAPIQFELHATPGAQAWLLRSFALAPTPIELPRIGALHLDPASLSSASMGTVPASGVATHATTASLLPGMIGRTLWFQGLTAGPRRLSTDFVQLTIVP